MTEQRPRKQVLLRLDPVVHEALARWASDELRSANAQIEFLLRKALTDAGRLSSAPGPLPRRGRPPKAGEPPRADPRGRPAPGSAPGPGPGLPPGPAPGTGREPPPGPARPERPDAPPHGAGPGGGPPGARGGDA
ncbi:hypothetical protein [Streptomyces pyxinae]|uniref:hypothetical protein n=1 Tax=Streptomyces pyxinae TaxID=2970734 RepID=UPI003D186661